MKKLIHALNQGVGVWDIIGLVINDVISTFIKTVLMFLGLYLFFYFSGMISALSFNPIKALLASLLPRWEGDMSLESYRYVVDAVLLGAALITYVKCSLEDEVRNLKEAIKDYDGVEWKARVVQGEFVDFYTTLLALTATLTFYAFKNFSIKDGLDADLSQAGEYSKHFLYVIIGTTVGVNALMFVLRGVLKTDQMVLTSLEEEKAEVKTV